jgi:hypothetical protein
MNIVEWSHYSDKSFSITDDPIVFIRVEDSPKHFQVHKSVLYAGCIGLHRLLDVSTSEKNPLVLSRISAECFETVCRWLYSKELVVKELDNTNEATPYTNGGSGGTKTAHVTDVRDQTDQDYIHVTAENESDGTKSDRTNPLWYADLDRNGRIYARLVDLYAFATRYEATQLSRVIMLAWQRFSISCNSLPPFSVVNRAFTRMNGDEPLCEYIILWYGYFNVGVSFVAKDFSSTPSKFLAGVLEIMYQKQAGGHLFAGLDKNWCDFHNHTEESEIKECQKAREQDPDVVSKRTEELWDSISPARREG